MRLLAGSQRVWLPGPVKPPGIPRINWNHPLAQGLLFYGFDTGDGNIVDLARGLPMALPGYTASPKSVGGTTQWGTGLKYNNSDIRVFVPDAAIQNASAGANYSFACAYVQTGTGGTNARPFGRTANNNQTPAFLNWIFQVGSTQANMDCYAYGNSTFNLIASWGGNSNNQFHSLCGVIDSTTHASYYADGQLVGSTTLGAGTWGSYTTTGDQIIFGGARTSPSASAPFVGFTFYGALWTRALTADEILQLHIDPYAMLEPPEPFMGMILPPTGSAGMAFSGITIAASGSDIHASAVRMTFGGIAISAASRASHTGPASLAFSGLTYSSAGVDRRSGTTLMAFSGLSFAGAGLDNSGHVSMAFSGVGIAAAGIDEHAAATRLTFSGITIASTGIRSRHATVRMTFRGLSMKAAGRDIRSRKKTHTGTAKMAFKGISVRGSSRRNAGTGRMTLTGLSISTHAVDITGRARLTFSGGLVYGAGGSHKNATVAMAFSGIAISVGSSVRRIGTGAMHLTGITITAAGGPASPAGTGTRQFWTFG